MKLCTDCQETKPLSDFSINRNKKDGLNYRCKSCQRAYFKTYYEKNKKSQIGRVAKRTKRVEVLVHDYVNELKKSPCVDCGQSFPPCAMDFDHVRGEKFTNVSRLYRWGLPIVKLEIEKCDLVCANCHRIRTHITRKK